MFTEFIMMFKNNLLKLPIIKWVVKDNCQAVFLPNIFTIKVILFMVSSLTKSWLRLESSSNSRNLNNTTGNGIKIRPWKYSWITFKKATLKPFLPVKFAT